MMGGKSGISGNGGEVFVNSAGLTQTSGARAIGLVGQSIGGGGGFFTGAASNITATTVQNVAGASGTVGGPVVATVEAGGRVITAGAGEWGMLAQSIGGGFAGDPSQPLVLPVSNTLRTSASAALGSGTVSATINGIISTSGANAHGVVAQSIASGGGITQEAAGTKRLLMGNSGQIYGGGAANHPRQAGAVSVAVAAGSMIATSGVGSIGIVAQSSGVLTSANGHTASVITLDIGGAVLGGTNTGYDGGGVGAVGILVSGGSNTAQSRAPDNLIKIRGGVSVNTMDGPNGTAIRATDSLINVNNAGFITGGIDLGATPGHIPNTGTMNLGPTLVAASMDNHGTVNPGGSGQVRTSVHLGTFRQSATGVLGIDINAGVAGGADLLRVIVTAEIAGRVVP